MPMSLPERVVRRLMRDWRTRVAPYIAYAAGAMRSPDQLVSAWPEGEIPLGPRVCVFTHWDGAGAVRPHVFRYLQALAAEGLSIVFVTNSGRLRPEAMAALQTICAGVLVRRNIGYDFGAWREGFARLKLPRANTEMVVMANDSVYGPLRPLAPLLSRIDFRQADIWGPTESWQTRYHLQSYLVAFSPKVVASEAWRRFWEGVRPIPSKQWIVSRYEVGLSQALIRAGFRCRAVWPYKDLLALVDPEMVARAGTVDDKSDPTLTARWVHSRHIRDANVLRLPLNPTNDLWRQLLYAGFPFVKRELLRDNPTHVADVFEWREVVQRLVQADPDFIEQDLQRSMRNRAP